MLPSDGARRLHRGVRAAVTALVLGAVAVTGAITVSPAEAAPASPKVKLVSGNGALTAAWSAVSGATSYTVKISKKKSLSNAKVVKTSSRSVRVAKLRNGTPYYVAVTANRTVITPSIVRSSVVTAKPMSGVPYDVSNVTVTSGPGENQVTVAWSGGGRAQKVAVIAGSSVLANERSFHTPWYPATTRSIVVTVPPQFQAYMGAGTGNPVWARVVQSNSTSGAFGASYSYDRKYRPSTPGTYAFAKPAAAPANVSKLKVAELNTQTVEATTNYSKTNRWAARAPRVTAYIQSANPDLLLTAELSTGLVRSGCQNSVANNTFPCASDTQYSDLARRLSPTLKLADTDAYRRVTEAMRLDNGKWQGDITSGAHIFYNPAKMALLDHGFFAPARSVDDHRVTNVEGLGVSPWNPRSAVSVDRWISWAKFQISGTNRQFYAVAAHFPVGDAKIVVDTRAQLTTKLIAAIQQKAGNVPIVFGGDVNSDATRSAQPVQPAFIRAGWFDAAATPSKALRSGTRVSTANGSGKQQGIDPGYGPKPIYHPYLTSRIDYILLKNSPHTYKYENVMRLHKDGTFIKSLQGSDHNMQLATIGIGDPVS